MTKLVILVDVFDFFELRRMIMKYRIHRVLFAMMLVGTLSMGLLGCNQKTDSASTTTVTTQAISEYKLFAGLP